MRGRGLAALAGGFALASLSEGAPALLVAKGVLFALILALLQALASSAVPIKARAIVQLWAASPVALPFVYLLCRLRHVDAWTPVGIVGGLLTAGFIGTVIAAVKGKPWTRAEAWPAARLRRALPAPEQTVPLWLVLPLLAAILGLGFWLRWPLLHEGLPYSWVWDEVWTTHEAVRMWQAGDWLPRVTYYPGLALYSQLLWLQLWGGRLVGSARVISGMQMGTDLWVLSPSVLLLSARLLSTLLAGAAVLALYNAASLAYGRIGALVVAAWLALDPWFLRYSTWTVVDLSTAVTVSLWLWALARHLQRPSRWSGRWLALAAGLVIASKYNAAVVLIVSVAVTVPWRQGWRALLRAKATTVAWALAAYAAASPTFFFDLRGVAAGLQYNVDMYSAGGHTGFTRIDSHPLKAWHDVCALAAQSSAAPAFLALPLIAWLAWRGRARAAGWALATAALYVALMAKTVVCNDANLLLLVPLLVFAAGQAVAWVAERGTVVAALALSIALLWGPVAQDLQARQSALQFGDDARHRVALRAAALLGDGKVAVEGQSRLHREDMDLFQGHVMEFDYHTATVAKLRAAGATYALFSDLQACPDLARRFASARVVAVEGAGPPVTEGSPAHDPRTWLVDLSKAP